MAISLTQSRAVWTWGDADLPRITARGKTTPDYTWIHPPLTELIGTQFFDALNRRSYTYTEPSSVLVRPPNRTQSLIGEVYGGSPAQGDVARWQLQTFGLFPFQPDYEYEHEEELVAFVSSAPNKKTVSVRYKDDDAGTGETMQRWRIGVKERDYPERMAVRDFWRFHKYHIPFYYRDLSLGEYKLVRFDSSYKTQPASAANVGYSYVLAEWG